MTPRGMRRLRERLRALVEEPPAEDGLVGEAPAVVMRELFARFGPSARPYRAVLAAGLAVAVVVPLFEAAEIWLFKLVVDDVLVPRDLGPLPWIALGYLAVTLVGGLFGFLDS